MRRGRRHLLGAALVLATVAACGDDAPSGAGSGVSDLPWGTTFLSTELAIDDPDDDRFAAAEVRLTFHDDGRVTANAGCNTLGLDDVSLDDGRLVATGGSMTEMGCPADLHAQDDWLVGFLTSSPRWTLVEATLVLATGEAEMTLVDREVAEPDRAFEGTRWVLDSIHDDLGSPDGAVSSVPEGVEADLTFEGGQVGGRGGCNGFGGPATIAGDEVTFGPIVSTLLECDAVTGDVESAVLGVLAGTVEWTVDGDRLVLAHPSGAGLGFRAAD